VGNSPADVGAFLRAHHFQFDKYVPDYQFMTGTALLDGNGTYTEIPARAVVKININFSFGDDNRLTGYNVEAASPGHVSDEDEDEEQNKHYTDEFASPDLSCRLLYHGYSNHGEGTFFDVSHGKKESVLKTYLRLGPDVNWITNSIAEVFVSEGSPAYHSYYYDCVSHRTSPSYFLVITFDPKDKLVATLDTDGIDFYKLFSDKPFHQVKVPDFDTLAFFDCDNDSAFKGPGLFHLQSTCAVPKGINKDIKLPQQERAKGTGADLFPRIPTREHDREN
jgi:hypothetical protein